MYLIIFCVVYAKHIQRLLQSSMILKEKAVLMEQYFRSFHVNQMKKYSVKYRLTNSIRGTVTQYHLSKLRCSYCGRSYYLILYRWLEKVLLCMTCTARMCRSPL